MVKLRSRKKASSTQRPPVNRWTNLVLTIDVYRRLSVEEIKIIVMSDARKNKKLLLISYQNQRSIIGRWDLNINVQSPVLRLHYFF